MRIVFFPLSYRARDQFKHNQANLPIISVSLQGSRKNIHALQLQNAVHNLKPTGRWLFSLYLHHLLPTLLSSTSSGHNPLCEFSKPHPVKDSISIRENSLALFSIVFMGLATVQFFALYSVLCSKKYAH